ncbi:MAG: hypothetical protein BM485_02675 [Desulfobulbaceae bacterium DB1]|nr:MAG: hypothetical protein BM485_02675 [Desulfobulbaceae bacterium DB1]
MPTALLLVAASAAAAGRGFLFFFFRNGCRFFFSSSAFSFFRGLFLSADRTPFVAASTAARGSGRLLLSANCTVVFCASAAAAKGDTAV